MAFTDEQQAQIDFTIATETARTTSQLALHAKQAKVTAVQIAQQTLIANSNNQPVSERQISATDITAFADTLVNYINA